MSRKSLSASVAICFLAAFAGHLTAQDSSPFRMEGFVTEEGTQRPISGATVQVLIQSERIPQDRVRSTQTDANGRYSLPLPMGHGWVWQLLPPPGYSPGQALQVEQFATTVGQPVFKKDYQVRKGTAWQIEGRAPAAALPLAKTYFTISQQRDNQYISAYCELGPNPHSWVTLPLDAAGEFRIQCGDVAYTLS